MSVIGIAVWWSHLLIHLDESVGFACCKHFAKPIFGKLICYLAVQLLPKVAGMNKLRASAQASGCCCYAIVETTEIKRSMYVIVHLMIYKEILIAQTDVRSSIPRAVIACQGNYELVRKSHIYR